MFALRNRLAVIALAFAALCLPRPVDASIPVAIAQPQLTQPSAAPTLPTTPTYVLLYVAPDGSCRVEFCRNDPVNLTDPTGLCPSCGKPCLHDAACGHCHGTDEIGAREARAMSGTEQVCYEANKKAYIAGKFVGSAALIYTGQGWIVVAYATAMAGEGIDETQAYLRNDRPWLEKRLKKRGYTDEQIRTIRFVDDLGQAGVLLAQSVPRVRKPRVLGNSEPVVSEPDAQTSLKDVSKTVFKDGRLPENFITKEQAKALGWSAKKGNLADVAPGKSIGGNVFENRPVGGVSPLPEAPGRVWYEADLSYQGGFRSGERLLYSSDGLIYYSGDHYTTFQMLGAR